MNGAFWKLISLAGLALLLATLAVRDDRAESVPPGRREVIFWHLWGGKELAVVEDIVDRFNASQDEHFVRAVAMPGNNLDLKFFLGVLGDEPPDLLNQDDPIVADWAHRGALVPLDQLASPEEYAALDDWLFPPARELGSYDGRLFALCNGLDIRALYYNETMLESFGLEPPRTLAELDHLAETVAPPEEPGPRRQYGYLPDPRRRWAWGIVFGGEIYDAGSGEVLVDSEPIVRSLEWMASYSRRYGADRVAAFRADDQALPGAAFPLLQGRYAAIMDGQWRVPLMAEARRAAEDRGERLFEYGVVPLPPPPGGRPKAGWVNGNFFVVPRGAKNPEGAWAFMKFWSGFGGHEAEAARTAAAGGWIPASQAVVKQPEFQDYLRRYPEFGTFVELAASSNQVPTPVVPGAPYFQAEVIRAAEDAIYRGVPAREALEAAAARIRNRLAALEAD